MDLLFSGSSVQVTAQRQVLGALWYMVTLDSGRSIAPIQEEGWELVVQPGTTLVLSAIQLTTPNPANVAVCYQCSRNDSTSSW